MSRVRRKVKADWDAWNSRSLAGEPIVRLILDGTVVRIRLDRKATPRLSSVFQAVVSLISRSPLQRWLLCRRWIARQRRRE